MRSFNDVLKKSERLILFIVFYRLFWRYSDVDEAIIIYPKKGGVTGSGKWAMIVELSTRLDFNAALLRASPVPVASEYYHAED